MDLILILNGGKYWPVET